MDMNDIFLTLGPAFMVLFLLWFFFCTDADLMLAFCEKFGRPVSVYRGKVVWVTGASTGLGEAMAHELASVGAKLVLTARSKDLLQDVKGKCLEIAEGKLRDEDILVLPLDVTDSDAHQGSVNDVLNHFGQIDVLVNNAARYQIGPIINTETGVEKEIFDVNFFGAINLTKLVLKHFLERGKGQFVVLSSMAGKCGVPSCAVYTATKHALHGYYEALRMEHHNNSIYVTIVCPGIFKSSMFEKCILRDDTREVMKDLRQYECSQMTSSRCAHLTLVAMANRLYEAWVANQPFLLMMWGAQYTPDLNRRIMTALVYTKRRVKELNEGIWPTDLPTWQPFFR